MSWSTSHPLFSKRSLHSARGFTLVEVLVAISILAILLTSVYGIFSSVSLARERLDDDSADYHRARVLFDRLGRELRGTYFQARSRDLVFAGSQVDDRSFEFELTTSAVSPLSQTGSGLARIHYLLIEDEEDTEDGRVLLRSEHPVHESVDETAAGMMRLIPGIEAMTLRFYADGQWQTTWNGMDSGLPELVEIALRLRSGGNEPVDFISAFEVPKVMAR
jgi:general secretion pathway protein J